MGLVREERGTTRSQLLSTWAGTETMLILALRNNVWAVARSKLTVNFSFPYSLYVVPKSIVHTLQSHFVAKSMPALTAAFRGGAWVHAGRQRGRPVGNGEQLADCARCSRTFDI